MKPAKNIILNIISLTVILLLAGSTVYFYLKNQEHSQKQVNQANVYDNNIEKTQEVAPKTGIDPEATENKLVNTKPAPSSTRPSNPIQTYTIGPGETLSGISGKLNMNWTRIAEANNLENGDSIKEGQVLIIPSYDEKTKKLFIEFKMDEQKATQIQDQSATSQDLLYLDPTKTAKNDAVGFYGLTQEDNYNFVSMNESDGTAIVEVLHLDKKYQINLMQPLKKGKDGIWAISQIIPS